MSLSAWMLIELICADRNAYDKSKDKLDRKNKRAMERIRRRNKRELDRINREFEEARRKGLWP
jgi:hypothetical protein